MTAARGSGQAVAYVKRQGYRRREVRRHAALGLIIGRADEALLRLLPEIGGHSCALLPHRGQPKTALSLPGAFVVSTVR